MSATGEQTGPTSRDGRRGALTHGVDVWGNSFEFNSVIFDGDTASCSATGPMGVGIDFRKVDGRWKVRSLASRPNTPKAHLARLQAYTPAITRITEGVKKGSFKTPNHALEPPGRREKPAGGSPLQPAAALRMRQVGEARDETPDV